MVHSTRAMRRTIYERDILPKFRNRPLTEIEPDDLRALCAKVKDRGAPATTIRVRDIVKQIYGFAILHGEKVANPADEVGPSSIATFLPKDRALSPAEIRIMLNQLEHVATLPTIRLGLKLILLTMVRKAVRSRLDHEGGAVECERTGDIHRYLLALPRELPAVRLAAWQPLSDADVHHDLEPFVRCADLFDRSRAALFGEDVHLDRMDAMPRARYPSATRS